MTQTSVEAYKDMLEHSYNMVNKFYECPPESKLAFLADHVFDFTTYDDTASELFAKKALEVCRCISVKCNFNYHGQNEENYQWYLLMVNMPFFEGKLEWGTSIRGAWWDNKVFEIKTCGFFDGEDQILEIKFNETEWLQFVEAMEGFAND